MAKVNFYLNRPKSSNETIIQLCLSFNNNRVKIVTGESIHPRDWNAKTQRARKSLTGEVEFNEILDKMKAKAQKAYRELILADIYPTPVIVKDELERSFDRKPPRSFFTSLEEYIAISKNDKVQSTIKKYIGTKNHLKKFSKAKKQPIDFNSINLIFHEKFKNYLLEEKQLTNNTVAKYIKALKTFMAYAVENGYTSNMEFKKFKVKEIEGTIVFLTLEELMKLKNLKIGPKHLRQVRDVFCFQSFTGLRFSDVSNLKHEHINNDVISIRAQKTKEFITIPLNPYAKEILNRYRNNPIYALPVISNQKMNFYLKEVGKLAELDSKVIMVRYRGAERLETSLPKYQVLTTHVGRKTFITNSIYLGLRSEVLMEITGHKTHKAYKRYYRLVDTFKKEEMNKAWNHKNIAI